MQQAIHTELFSTGRMLVLHLCGSLYTSILILVLTKWKQLTHSPLLLVDRLTVFLAASDLSFEAESILRNHSSFSLPVLPNK